MDSQELKNYAKSKETPEQKSKGRPKAAERFKIARSHKGRTGSEIGRGISLVARHAENE